MVYNIFKRTASTKLGTKSILAVVLLISIISITLTSYFVANHKKSYTVELKKRAFSLASNLANDSQWSVFSGDIKSIKMLLDGVRKESDIENAFITDNDGIILAHPDSARIGEEIDINAYIDPLEPAVWMPTDLKNVWRTITQVEIERPSTESDEKLIFSSENNSNTKRAQLGYVILDVSLESMNRDLSVVTRNAIIITIVIIIFGALGVVYLVRSIANPIHFLAEVTRAVAQGDLNKSVPIDRKDEIGVLANSFNHMIQQLKISREKIESWNRELESKVSERTAELEEKHQELENAYEELKTLDKAKDDFLSLVSHELRTPLSSILLYSEMLLSNLADTEEERDHYLSAIVDSCTRLTRLINDVLDLSKIEAGRMPFTIDKLHIRTLIQETHTSIRPKLESKTLDFNYDQISDDTYLLGDKDRIIQVLTNIISNSIKFTPENGSITVTLTDHGKGMGLFTIKDTGIGINKDDIPKVFDRFNQLENIDNHSEGTGLGMTISKSIIERLGGEIWIKSTPKKGTKVFLTLPKINTEVQ